MAESLIEIRGVNKVFDLGKLQVHALRDMELDIFQGEYLSIMGPCGSGKKFKQCHGKIVSNGN